MRFQSALLLPAAAVALAATTLARPTQPRAQPAGSPIVSRADLTPKVQRVQPRDDSSNGVTGTKSCRSMTTADINGLNDDQLLQLLNKINSMFSQPIYDLSTNEATDCFFGTVFCDPNEHNIRKFRNAQFGGKDGQYQASYPDMKGKISILGNDDLNQHIGLNPGQICLDATQITSTGYQAGEGTACKSTTLHTYGTLDDAGQITIGVTQGYTTSYSTSTETSSTIGGSLGVEIGFTVFGTAESKVTASISYETSTTNGVEKGTENSSETSVQVQINPQPGQTCSMAIDQTTCPGSVDLSFPITTPSGQLRIEFFKVPCGAFSFCDYEDPPTKNGVAGDGQFVWYVDVAELYSGISDLTVHQHISTSLTSSGTYKESCSASDGTTPGGGTPSTSYVPSIKCPNNLGVLPSACSATVQDYLESGLVTGDTANWGFNKAVLVQSPSAGSTIPYGQTLISFNVSTPYQSASCSAYTQIVPPWGATFEPESPVLELPQYSKKVSTEYRVGYVGKCDPLNQYGACTITNIQSRYDPGFVWTQTSNVGNPIQVFDFSTTSDSFPEVDRYTFTLSCKDMYGNVGAVTNYQDAYRGDIATATIAANTAVQTFHSTTKYLYTSVKTLYTSVVTPLAYKTLKTDTLYTGTTYTSTRTITNYGAPKFSATKRVTLTETDKTTKFKTIHPTVTPDTKVVKSTRTIRPTTTVVETTSKGVKTSSVTATKTHTKVVVRTAAPVACEDKRADNQRVIGTTTITNAGLTSTIADYTGTFTDVLSATTTSTDALDFAQTTLSSTSTVYDPFGTAIASGIKQAVKTRILNSFTVTSTKKLTTTTTTTRTRTRTEPTTVATPTSTSVTRKTLTTTETSLKNKPTSTKSLTVATTTVTTTSFSTVTPPCTRI